MVTSKQCGQTPEYVHIKRTITLAAQRNMKCAMTASSMEFGSKLRTVSVNGRRLEDMGPYESRITFA
jgi:hypothetical protein